MNKGNLVKVPDLLRAWPWQRHLNEHYEEAKAASLAWVASFRAFDAKSQDAFDRCDFGSFPSCHLSLKDRYPSVGSTTVPSSN